MKTRIQTYCAIGMLALFLGATFQSCAAKKKCHPPCPTWQKKRPK